MTVMMIALLLRHICYNVCLSIIVYVVVMIISIVCIPQLLDAKMAELAREADDGWDTGAGAVEGSGSSASVETTTDSDSREGHSPFKIVHKV